MAETLLLLSGRAMATDPVLADLDVSELSLNLDGRLRVAATATPISGTGFTVVTTASTNASNKKASAGNLFEITVSNPTATAAFLKLYNKATTPTVGTDVPILTLSIPANSAGVYAFGFLGKRFEIGISMAVTPLITVADTTNAVAGIQISGTYV